MLRVTEKLIHYVKSHKLIFLYTIKCIPHRKLFHIEAADLNEIYVLCRLSPFLRAVIFHFCSMYRWVHDEPIQSIIRYPWKVFV